MAASAMFFDDEGFVDFSDIYLNRLCFANHISNCLNISID